MKVDFMAVVVLRLNHRIERDKRITSHVCLTARALGADKVILSGEQDGKIIETVEKIVANWGGKFEIDYRKDWLKVIREHKRKGWLTVHLTMYGLRLEKEVKGIRKAKNVLVIVGSEKVQRAVYEESDLNVAVTGQPHSEVAALAVFLHELFQGKELGNEFKGAKIKIEPVNKGKKVVDSRK
ncbi:MAG: tRNA (cytidine(56)-2'-O)-methyltransferase [Candidatus Micrarchaeota archaeon]